MIIVIHNFNKVLKVLINDLPVNHIEDNIIRCMFKLASEYKDEYIVWVFESLVPVINKEFLKEVNFNEIHTYNPLSEEFLCSEIGFADFRSVFLNINKKIKYNTWQLSGYIGVLHSPVLNNVMMNIPKNDFDYFLVRLGMTSLKHGLLVYSNPNLLSQIKDFNLYHRKSSLKQLFNFVYTNYSIKQFLLLFIAFTFFKRKFVVYYFLINILRQKDFIKINKQFVTINAKNNFNKSDNSIDIIIPTLGREGYLNDVLNDINCQIHLPKNVIIIEQIGESGSDITEYKIENKQWDFNLIHLKLNKYGAVNARNVGMKYIESKWTFFADDDIRLENNLINDVLQYLDSNKINGVSIASYKKGETIDVSLNPFSWSEFSSGCSIVRSDFVVNTKFDSDFEFGFGEDTDYGIQLRNKGCEILYFNKTPIFHIKAPIGGFRKKILKKWSNQKIQPYPEPTITKCAIKNYNSYQLLGFKLYYFLKGNSLLYKSFLRYIKLKKSFYFARQI